MSRERTDMEYAELEVLLDSMAYQGGFDALTSPRQTAITQTAIAQVPAPDVMNDWSAPDVLDISASGDLAPSPHPNTVRFSGKEWTRAETRVVNREVFLETRDYGSVVYQVDLPPTLYMETGDDRRNFHKQDYVNRHPVDWFRDSTSLDVNVFPDMKAYHETNNPYLTTYGGSQSEMLASSLWDWITGLDKLVITDADVELFLASINLGMTPDNAMMVEDALRDLAMVGLMVRYERLGEWLFVFHRETSSFGDNN